MRSVDESLTRKVLEIVDLDEIVSSFRRFVKEAIEVYGLNLRYESARGDIAYKVKEFITVMLSEPNSSRFRELCRHVGRVHLEKGVPLIPFLEAMGELGYLFMSYISSSGSNSIACSMCACINDVISYASALVADSYHTESVKRLARVNIIHRLLREINKLAFLDYETDEEFFKKITDAFVRVGEFPLVWVGALGKDGKTVRVLAYKTTRDEKLVRKLMSNTLTLDYWRKSGLWDKVEELFSGKVVLIDNLTQVLPDDERKKLLRALGLNRVLVLPLMSEDRVVGAIFVYGAGRRRFTEEDRLFLGEISKDVSLGWVNLRKKKQIQKMLFVDELTGIGNRRFFMEALEREIEIARERRSRLALIRLDIDGLSVINHNYGYSVGDLVIKSLAQRLLSLVGNSGVVARVGADDFAATYVVVSVDGFKDFVFRLNKALSMELDIGGGRSVKASVSVGVAFFPDDSEDPSELFDRATLALKKASTAGHGRVFFYSESGAEEVVEEYRLLEELERALEENQFVLYYQPRVGLRERKVVGFEALLRWNHPERGIIAPGAFIDVLEKSGLIIDVGYWVIRESARFWKRVSEVIPDCVVSFNVSANQFLQEDFPHRLAKVLMEEGVNPGFMEMEITERMLVEAGENLPRIMDALSGIGLQISIDDFGTGYSSMVYLKRIPSRCLKVDYTFVSGIPDDREDVDVVMAIVNLARSFGKKAVAEGVETREQLVFLTALGVGEVQGYYFARPMPEDEALRFAREFSPERFFWSGRK